MSRLRDIFASMTIVIAKPGIPSPILKGTPQAAPPKVGGAIDEDIFVVKGGSVPMINTAAMPQPLPTIGQKVVSQQGGQTNTCTWHPNQNGLMVCNANFRDPTHQVSGQWKI